MKKAGKNSKLVDKITLFNNSEIQELPLLIVLLAVSVIYASPPLVRWLKTFPKGTRTHGSWVAQTGDGGYVVAGTWRPDNESFDFYLVKTDSLGNLQWDKTLGVGPSAWVYSGCLSKDGGYVLAGEKQDNISNTWALLVKTDSLGNTIWSKGFEQDTNPYVLAANSVQQTQDGAILSVVTEEHLMHCLSVLT